MASMARKLILVVIFALSIMLFSMISVYAEDGHRGDFFIKNVIVNGETIVNYNMHYSIVLNNDNMYIPLTSEMCEIFGIEAEMDWESNTLKIFRAEPTRKNISVGHMINDAKPLRLSEIPDASVGVYEREVSFYIFDTLEMVEMPEMRVDEIELNGMPLLEVESVVYIPLRSIANSKYLNWDIHFYEYFGICISTVQGVPAVSFFDRAEALRIRGLVNFIMRINSTVGESYAQQLVFLFKRASEVFDVDYVLLMAVAQTESRFDNGAVGRGGAAGMMQVMPGTGARYGLTPIQLMDPKIAIDFGALYLSERIEAFDGNWILGLSAYNQGSARVNRGTHSTSYAELVMARYERIGEYLHEHGFIL